MALSEKETIVSLDFNFSNGSGGHSATITSVVGAKDLSTDDAESLGSLIGLRGARVTFTNDKIDTLLNNFIVTETTTSRDSVGVTVVRKLQDLTSLKLKSNCLIVRGRDAHPRDKGSFGIPNNNGSLFTVSGGGNLRGQQNIPASNAANPASQGSVDLKGSAVIIPYFGEVTNSPITNSTRRYPRRNPYKKGGVIYIGNIYNEESSIDLAGNKVSLVYQDRLLQDGAQAPLDLSHNDEFVGAYYKQNPDYTNYALRFGYTLKEAATALNMAGITVVNFPGDSSVLLEESGTLDSIVSAIASKFGYYWFIDPLTGAINFINSSSASQLKVYNPLSNDVSTEVKKTFIDASFTQNEIQPRIVNAFSSTIERAETTFENDTAERFTRFTKINVNNLLSFLKIDTSLLKAFYILYACGKYEDRNIFRAYVLLLQSMSKASSTRSNQLRWAIGDGNQDNKEDDDTDTSHWPDAGLVPSYDDKGDYAEVFSDKGEYEERSNLGIKLKKCEYIHIKKNNTNKVLSDPSNYPIYDKIKLIYESLNNSLYLSHRFGKWKAQRMSWQNSSMNIEGPFDLDSKISDIDSMQNINAVYTTLGVTDKTLRSFYNSIEGITGPDDGYGFIGLVNNGDKNIGSFEAGQIDWKDFNEASFQFINVHGETYLAFTEEFKTAVLKLYNTSIALWKKVTDNVEAGKTMKASYLRGKTTVSQVSGENIDPEKQRKQEEAADRRQAGLDSIAQYLSELSERFDERYYSLNLNGANGEWSNPIRLDVKQGKIADIRALENNNISSLISNAPPSQSSSRTIVGLSIPEEFSITISSLSIKLGNNGITTTISESTQNLISPDEQLIIDKNGQAIAQRSLMNRFNASQKNFLGL